MHEHYAQNLNQTKFLLCLNLGKGKFIFLCFENFGMLQLLSIIILRCPCDHDHNVSGQTIMSGGPRVSLHHPGEQYLNLELYKYIQTYFLVYPIITVMITLLRATFGENKSKPSGMRTLYSHGLRI
jgi:hypothetical protein